MSDSPVTALLHESPSSAAASASSLTSLMQPLALVNVRR